MMLMQGALTWKSLPIWFGMALGLLDMLETMCNYKLYDMKPVFIVLFIFIAVNAACLYVWGGHMAPVINIVLACVIGYVQFYFHHRKKKKG